MFLRQQLEYISNRIVEKSYPEMKMASGQLVPIDRECPPGADTYAYSLFTKVGEAAVLANAAEDIPNVTGFMEKRFAEIYDVAAQYHYTLNDIKRAEFAKVNLDARLALAARESIERKIDMVGYQGEQGFKLLGLLNQPNIPVFVLPADGNSNGGIASTRFIHKTAEQIYRDLVNFVTSIRISTNDVEVADTLLLPTEQFELIAHLPYTLGGIASDKSVLQTFLDNQRLSGGIQRVVSVPYLKGFGAGNTDMMVAYKNDESKLFYEIPQEIEMLPQEYYKATYHYPLMARVAGVIVIKPFSASYSYNL